MTQEQREKLFEIMGQIEGLGWGVENQQISEGFCGVVEDLDKLLREDADETPDTIKKGLLCCSNSNIGCSQCPYDDYCGIQGEGDTPEQDALACIQQLETRLAQVEREREALMDDLQEAAKAGSVCTGCAYDVDFGRPCEIAYFDCKQCKEPCPCQTCQANSQYKWRGVCEEDTKEKEHADSQGVCCEDRRG